MSKECRGTTLPLFELELAVYLEVDGVVLVLVVQLQLKLKLKLKLFIFDYDIKLQLATKFELQLALFLEDGAQVREFQMGCKLKSELKFHLNLNFNKMMKY